MTDFGLKVERLNKILAVLARYPQVKRAVIFGSRARSDYKYNSDIDLAIYTEDGIPAGLRLDLDEAAGIYKMDVVDMKYIDNKKFQERIENEGAEIYRS